MFTLKISTANDAFAADPTPELARILREVADRLDAGADTPGIKRALRDINGNVVGSFLLKDA